MTLMHPLIQPDALQRQLSETSTRCVVLDASWHLPNVKRNAHEEYQKARIPGAVFFDIDAVSDAHSDLPHMLPTAEVFAEATAAMGIGPEDTVVVYDSAGLFSAARVWWMFRVMGHTRVQVLDGGLPAWKSMGGELESGEVAARAAVEPMHAELDINAVCDVDGMLQAIDVERTIILDARPKARFDAAVPEPRPGLRSGHIPSSQSLPFTELLSADSDGAMRLKTPDELKSLLESYGVGQDTSVITTCGSGVTAAVITLALVVAGFDLGKLYDGSWSEWGARDDTPITVVHGD